MREITRRDKNCPECNTLYCSTLDMDLTHHFHRNSSQHDGLNSWCKRCKRKDANDRYIRTRSEPKKPSKGPRKSHPDYGLWVEMRSRCNSTTNKNYNRYGGRGISLCKEWNDFLVFNRDMGDRPKGMSIDRIDNNKGYSKSNCRWATKTQQVGNTRIKYECRAGHKWTKANTIQTHNGRAPTKRCRICLDERRGEKMPTPQIIAEYLALDRAIGDVIQCMLPPPDEDDRKELDAKMAELQTASDALQKTCYQIGGQAP